MEIYIKFETLGYLLIQAYLKNVGNSFVKIQKYRFFSFCKKCIRVCIYLIQSMYFESKN